MRNLGNRSSHFLLDPFSFYPLTTSICRSSSPRLDSSFPHLSPDYADYPAQTRSVRFLQSYNVLGRATNRDLADIDQLKFDNSTRLREN